MRHLYNLVFFIIILMFVYVLQPIKINASKDEIKFQKIVFGKTGMGRDMIYYRIDPPINKNKIKKTVLLTFEIHGYEDQYKKDGNQLVKIGNYIIKYFSENKDNLASTSLFVIPELNPDGLIDGTTNNGKGRCQVSLGIDMNRDFDFNFVHFSSGRYHTLHKPFGSPEARALRALVLKLKPDYIIDFHGWLNLTIGNKSLAKIFDSELRLPYSCGFSKKTPGYFSAWASTVCNKALMVEYPENCTVNPDKYSLLTINALTKVFSNIL